MVARILLGELPDALRPLGDLALDLRWTWSREADPLWQRIDGPAWERTRSPWLLLQTTPREELDLLAADPGFVAEVEAVAVARAAYLSAPGWLERTHGPEALTGVAYFSMEFGLGSALPLYAGGLGILAGDHLKSASDLGVPLSGIGLRYQEGYFRQMFDAEGRQQEIYPNNEPDGLPIERVRDERGDLLGFEIGLPGRRLMVRVWRAYVGRVELFLLDTNDPANTPTDRGITAQLYGGGTEVRLMQEIVLGIGGCRLLEALGREPEVYHLNEGHAAFAVLERARVFMRRHGCSFRDALWATRAGNVFTTHTSVGAAFDTFPRELIDKYFPWFRSFLTDVGISAKDLLALGRANGDDPDEPFNMAFLALRGSGSANGVSRLHGDVSRRLFSRLFPRWPEEEVPVGHVTNGVHVPSWEGPAVDGIWRRGCGTERWAGSVAAMPEPLADVSDGEVWAARVAQRKALIDFARERLAYQLGAQGAQPEEVERASGALDANTLTLGYARRFTAYKRPELMLRDSDRLRRILLDPSRPVQLLVAGKAHPRDEVGKSALQHWLAFADDPAIARHVVFLEDYDMTVGEHLVQGVDLWVNTPRRPWEACGTSGMKVLANGGLNLSTLDGWWDEAFEPDLGWAIGDRSERSDTDADARDAEDLYRLLEEEIVPLFYDRDGGGLPRSWLAHVRASMTKLAGRFSGNRMVEDYVEQAYLPAARAFRERAADGAGRARDLARWERRLRTHWNHLRFGESEMTRGGTGWDVCVPVYLGDLEPAEIRVELYAEAVGEWRSERLGLALGERIPGAINGYRYHGHVASERPIEDFTARVAPAFDGARVPLECNLVFWQR